MHVDGFRFDLASILSRDETGRPLPNPPVLWDIESDPVLAGTKLIAEAWDAAGLYQVGSFVGDSWKEWNGRFRDDVRRFLKGDDGYGAAAGRAAAGQPRHLRPQGARAGAEHQLRHLPRRLHAQRSGLLQPQAQRGERRGQPRRRRRQPELELRRRRTDRRSGDRGAAQPAGEELPRPDAAVRSARRCCSMGDEVRRTQRGNNNAYCQDNEISWFDWSAARAPRRHPPLREALNAFRQRRDVVAEGRGSASTSSCAGRASSGTASSSGARTGATTRTRWPSRSKPCAAASCSTGCSTPTGSR